MKKQCCLCNVEVKVFRKKMCNNCYRKQKLGKDCLDCGIRVWSVVNRCRNCNYKYRRGISLVKNIGSRNGMYTGGRSVNANGYVVVLVGIDEYKLEHRLVMEKHLGRPLRKEEAIHHIDGDKENNNISNLMLFSSSSEHIQYHWDTNWKKRRNYVQIS